MVTGSFRLMLAMVAKQDESDSRFSSYDPLKCPGNVGRRQRISPRAYDALAKGKLITKAAFGKA